MTDQSNVPAQQQSLDMGLSERVAKLEATVIELIGAVQMLQAQLKELGDAI